MLSTDTISLWQQLNKIWQNTKEGYTEQCEVLEVDKVSNTCTVRIQSIGLDKSSVKLSSKRTELNESPIVFYPEVGSIVAVSFTNDERDGVVVKIDKLEQFLLQKGANNITDAFRLLFEAIEILNNRVQLMDRAVDTNRNALRESPVVGTVPALDPDGNPWGPSVPLSTPTGGNVFGNVPSRILPTPDTIYDNDPNFEEKNNRKVESAREITEDIFGEPE